MAVELRRQLLLNVYRIKLYEPWPDEMNIFNMLFKIPLGDRPQKDLARVP